MLSFSALLLVSVVELDTEAEAEVELEVVVKIVVDVELVSSRDPRDKFGRTSRRAVMKKSGSCDGSVEVDFLQLVGDDDDDDELGVGEGERKRLTRSPAFIAFRVSFSGDGWCLKETKNFGNL